MQNNQENLEKETSNLEKDIADLKSKQVSQSKGTECDPQLGNLEEELKAAIEAKKTASRITISNEEGLKQRFLTLKAELDEVRSFNALVRRENDMLKAKLE